ncbi:MAG TPA: RnfABCDGE type electron transport complex subunit D [Casimicrobiaceae bacterium]|nr:RnfABCDGE type electron transport complex subunit D [Casimicrobiaceae bacterium]
MEHEVTNVVPLRPALPGAAALQWRARAFALGVWLRSEVPRDARVYQILFLGSLLSFGVLARDFSLHGEQMLLTFAAGAATQAFWLHRKGLRQRGYLSAIVTCFGLSILLRADSLWVHPLAAALAISAKFVIRVNGKHLFNPANFGLLTAIGLLPGAWTSPGQWGNGLAAAVWFVALGGIVTQRARRADIAWIFLATWLAIVALRVAWLGQSWSVWLHQLGNGGLLLFAFFMISDPMTIPNRTAMRIAYAVIVAAIAYVWQFGWFRPNALPWALLIATPLVPLLDRLAPAPVHRWK